MQGITQYNPNVIGWKQHWSPLSASSDVVRLLGIEKLLRAEEQKTFEENLKPLTDVWCCSALEGTSSLSCRAEPDHPGRNHKCSHQRGRQVCGAKGSSARSLQAALSEAEPSRAGQQMLGLWMSVQDLVNERSCQSAQRENGTPLSSECVLQPLGGCSRPAVEGVQGWRQPRGWRSALCVISGQESVCCLDDLRVEDVQRTAG